MWVRSMAGGPFPFGGGAHSGAFPPKVLSPKLRHFLYSQCRVYTKGLMTEELNSSIFETLLHVMKDASETQAIESSISVHLIQTYKAHSRGKITLKTSVFNQYRVFSRWEKVSAEQEFRCVCNQCN